MNYFRNWPERKAHVLVMSLFLAAVFSLVWRQGNFLVLPLPKIFESLIFILILVLAGIWMASPSERSLPDGFRNALRSRVVPLTALLLGPGIGLLFSAWLGLPWQQFAFPAGIEYLRILFALFLFCLTIYLAARWPGIVRWSMTAIAISPLLLWLALLPRLQGLLLMEWRLRGAGNDPNYLATWIAIAILISLTRFLYTPSRRAWWLVNAAVITPLVIWTGSRSAWLVLAVATLLLGAKYLFQKSSPFRLNRMVTMALALLFGFIAGFALLPSLSKVMFVHRGLGPFLSDDSIARWTDYLMRQGVAGVVGPSSPLLPDVNLQLNRKFFGYGQDRQDLWLTAARIALVSPFGYGPAYYEWRPLSMVGIQKLGSHNLWLETALTGGWLALLALFVLVAPLTWKAWALFLKSREDVAVALGMAWLALLALSFFLDMLTLRWLWLLLGFIAVYPQREEVG